MPAPKDPKRAAELRIFQSADMICRHLDGFPDIMSRAKMSLAKEGKSNPNAIAAMVASRKGKHNSTSHNALIAAGMKGNQNRKGKRVPYKPRKKLPDLTTIMKKYFEYILECE